MKYIKGFDGLRAISVVFVLFSHLGLYYQLENHPSLQKNFNLFSGESGVMIFFTISGFLITFLLLNEKLRNGRINFRNFFIRRFLRLLPPLLIFYLAVLILMLSGLLPENYIALGISFFYLYNFVPFTYYTNELGHTWSLGVEEQFYLFWPFIINRISKINRTLIFCLLIIALCIVWSVLSRQPVFFNGKDHYLSSYFYIERWFIPACLPIMMGAGCALIMLAKLEYCSGLFYRNYLMLILAILLYFAQLYIPHLHEIIIHLLQPAGISIFLLWIYFNQENFLVTLLELKPIAFLGKISYGIYVYQGLFLRTAPGGKLLIQKFPLNIILVFICAVLSYYLVELQVLKLKKHFKT